MSRAYSSCSSLFFLVLRSFGFSVLLPNSAQAGYKSKVTPIYIRMVTPIQSEPTQAKRTFLSPPQKKEIQPPPIRTKANRERHL